MAPRPSFRDGRRTRASTRVTSIRVPFFKTTPRSLSCRSNFRNGSSLSFSPNAVRKRLMVEWPGCGLAGPTPRIAGRRCGPSRPLPSEGRRGHTTAPAATPLPASREDSWACLPSPRGRLLHQPAETLPVHRTVNALQAPVHRRPLSSLLSSTRFSGQSGSYAKVSEGGNDGAGGRLRAPAGFHASDWDDRWLCGVVYGELTGGGASATFDAVSQLHFVEQCDEERHSCQWSPWSQWL